MIDLATTFDMMLSAVSSASAPDQAWAEVTAVGRKMGGTIPDDLSGMNALAETQVIVNQLREIVKVNPIPPNIRFLYFGLFSAVLQDTDEEGVGFYVAGGESNAPDPMIEREDLTYFPTDRFLTSPLLNRVKIEALKGGEDYNFFDYALMFGTAATLAKFALKELGLRKTLVVGFDSGDKASVT